MSSDEDAERPEPVRILSTLVDVDEEGRPVPSPPVWRQVVDAVRRALRPGSAGGGEERSEDD